jgi:methionine-R-sulfoxide reductase
MPYAVLREEATEPKFSSELNDVKDRGVFLCAGCAQPLFTSDAKFDSGTGWPSFWAPADPSATLTRTDFKAILPRQETVCARCNGHLGHVFDDGPPPTGLRYCMNGAAMTFESGTERSDQALASFAAAEVARPPLAKIISEAGLSGAVSLGLGYSFWVNMEAGAGAQWAIEALRGSDSWLFGAVNALFGRPPGGPLTLVLAGVNALTVAQKFALISAALLPQERERVDGSSD